MSLRISSGLAPTFGRLLIRKTSTEGSEPLYQMEVYPGKGQVRIITLPDEKPFIKKHRWTKNTKGKDNSRAIGRHSSAMKRLGKQFAALNVTLETPVESLQQALDLKETLAAILRNLNVKANVFSNADRTKLQELVQNGNVTIKNDPKQKTFFLQIAK